jgi:very-short-patch-repair endonuclease
LAARGLRLPSTSQKTYEQCGTRPDFVYEKQHTVIYVDGPPHDYPDRQQRDHEKTVAMEDLGIEVLRFHHQGDWAALIAQYPNIFGTPQATQPEADTLS